MTAAAGGWRPSRRLGTYTRRSPTATLIETYHDGYEVNDSAAFIWSFVGSGQSVAEIAEHVVSRYEIAVSEAMDAVSGFLGVLVDKGFIDRESD